MVVDATSAQGPAGPTAPVRLAAPALVTGNVSVTMSGFEVVSTGPFMSPGPLLVTVMVQVMVPLGDTYGVGLAVLVIVRS